MSIGTERLIKNYDTLISKGQTKVRKDALDIIECGIKRAIPYDGTRKLMKIEEGILKVGQQEFHLKEIKNIYVVGAGKGSFPIAEALNDLLGERIADGVVVVKSGEKRRLPNIEIFESSHPIPDERSVEGAKKILKILNIAGEKDIVFAAMTGGSSALVNLMPPEISIPELQEVNDLLLKCGASIGKINAVRKHLCLIKGGRVVAYGQPATVITFTLDTSPPDMPWPDMCLPDPTTFEDAIDVLKQYRIWNKVSQSIKDYLIKGMQDKSMETLKNLDGMNQYLFSVADPKSACEAMAAEARKLGYESHILSTTFEGEAKDLGIFLSGISNEIIRYDRPFKKPCTLISGGETTVTIGDECGVGGPNQETVLGFIPKLYTGHNITCVSIDSDGTDGPCDIAGGIVDGLSQKRAEEIGVDLNKHLKDHSSAEALIQLEDAIITGHTGTNIMNLRVVVIE